MIMLFVACPSFILISKYKRIETIKKGQSPIHGFFKKGKTP